MTSWSKNAPYYVLIDFAQLAHAAYHYLGMDHGGYSVDALEAKVRQKLRTVRRFLSEADYVLVLDEHSARKRRLYSKYKANHGPHRVPVLEVAQRLAPDFRDRICVSPDNEADDTIATLCARNTGFTVVVSSDQDLWQLMAKSVQIFNPIRKVFVEPQHIEVSYGRGLKPQHVPLAKALWGDAGDNVPIAIHKCRKELLSLVAQSTGDIQDFREAVEAHWDDLSDKARLAWMEGEEQAILNYELVKLDTNCEVIFGPAALERNQ